MLLDFWSQCGYDLRIWFISEKLNDLPHIGEVGLPPGAVPPFGKPIFELGLYVDKSVLENEYIAFNAGSLTKSIKLRVADYLKVAHPIIIEFS